MFHIQGHQTFLKFLICFRSRINQVFNQEGEEVHVLIKKAGIELDEEQQGC